MAINACLARAFRTHLRLIESAAAPATATSCRIFIFGGRLSLSADARTAMAVGFLPRLFSSLASETASQRRSFLPDDAQNMRPTGSRKTFCTQAAAVATEPLAPQQQRQQQETPSPGTQQQQTSTSTAPPQQASSQTRTEPFYYPGKGFAELGITPDKLLLPGDPDTYTVRIRDVMPVGYFVDMPSGREGYLPANDLGFSGGIERLRTIFQVGQEVVVRITFRGPSGRELLSIRKYDPERPPVEPPRIARSSGSPKHKYRHRR